jgi:serine/threonine protein kinase
MTEDNSVKTVKIQSPENMRICVVDDDLFVSSMISKVLNSAGFKSFAIFKNAEEFISKNITVNNHFSLVITDVVLPGINGFELCKKIKSFSPEIPVILISGYDIEDIYTRVLDSEADDFIPKPFSPTELLVRVKLHLAKFANLRMNNISIQSKLIHPDRPEIPYIGDQIDQFVITDSLGWGKSSIVFKVSGLKDKKFYSLKILAKHAAEFPDVVSRFQNEMTIMEKFRHPNIVSFVEKGFHHSVPFVVMEYVEGLDLEDYLITKGRIPLQNCFVIAHGIARAMSELHSHKIIHRDIKLKNILFDVVSQSPKLIDFGIAKKADSLHITRDGFILGTPIYMPPEIFEGETATEPSDIYSFGATIYHLATGSPPFVGESSNDLYKKHLSKIPDPIRKFRSDIPFEFDEIICGKCLAKVPSDRRKSMEIVADELKKFMTNLNHGKDSF